MRIAAASLRASRVPGPAARAAAYLELRDEEGRESAGEAAPIPGFSRESLSEAERALASVAPALGRIDEERDAFRAVAAALLPLAEALDPCPTARFAVETALFDLLAQRRGTSVAEVLRGARPAPFVETSALVEGVSVEGVSVEGALTVENADDIDPFVERALTAIRRGFRAVKVKLRASDDASLERELAGLAALRRAAPPGLELRLDPNGRWTAPQARDYLRRLAPVEPLFVEQPVAAHELLSLGPCEVPWAADESLGVAGLAERLTAEIGCGAFILKPAALGILRALELAEMAARRSLPVVVTHFMDGPVGLAAACELALSLAGGSKLLACGLDPHPGLRELPSSALPHHAAPGRVTLTGRAGLGVKVEAASWSAR